MKHLLIIALLAFYLTLYSQQSAPADSLQHGLNKADSIQLPTTPIDSAIQAVQAKLHASSDAPDSTKNRLQQQLNQLNKQQVTHQKLDSLQNLYQKRADSLQTLNLPHQNYLDKIDSITQLPGRKINQKLTISRSGNTRVTVMIKASGRASFFK